MFDFRKTALPNSALLHFYAAAFTSFIFCNNKSATNQFKRLLLIEEAHVRIKPESLSTRPNEASRKKHTATFQKKFALT